MTNIIALAVGCIIGTLFNLFIFKLAINVALMIGALAFIAILLVQVALKVGATNE